MEKSYERWGDNLKKKNHLYDKKNRNQKIIKRLKTKDSALCYLEWKEKQNEEKRAMKLKLHAHETAMKL